DAAVGAFRRVLALTPERSDVRKNLAYTLYKTGDDRGAQELFAEVVRRDSSDDHAALELAYLSYETLDPAAHAVAYRLFSRLRSSRDSIVRGTAAEAFHNVDAALEARMNQWRDALRQQPDNPDFSLEYARAAEERDQL